MRYYIKLIYFPYIIRKLKNEKCATSQKHLFLEELQSFSEIIETTAKNGVDPVAISNVKLF